MAQTILEIYEEIITEKEAQEVLNDLDNPSSVAIYKKWAYVTAVIHYLQQVLFDLFKLDVTAIADRKQYGTKPWFAEKAKAYQHGDLLQFINNIFSYAAIDPEKQVVKLVNVTDERGLVKIKAANLVGGEATQLTVNQVNGLQDYIEEIRPAGTRVTVESYAADVIKIYLDIYYNAAADLPVVAANVEAAITAYIASIDFDGIFYVNKMIDAIQAVPGVINEQVVVIDIAAKNGADPYTQITSKYQAKAGYFKVDPAYPLNTTLNYLT